MIGPAGRWRARGARARGAPASGMPDARTLARAARAARAMLPSPGSAAPSSVAVKRNSSDRTSGVTVRPARRFDGAGHHSGRTSRTVRIPTAAPIPDFFNAENASAVRTKKKPRPGLSGRGLWFRRLLACRSISAGAAAGAASDRLASAFQSTRRIRLRIRACLIAGQSFGAFGTSGFCGRNSLPVSQPESTTCRIISFSRNACCAP